MSELQKAFSNAPLAVAFHPHVCRTSHLQISNEPFVDTHSGRVTIDALQHWRPGVSLTLSTLEVARACRGKKKTGEEKDPTAGKYTTAILFTLLLCPRFTTS
jgi:hypothetical protein